MSWSGQGPGGRRGYHHGNLREALIQAALDLIAKKGPAGFTFADAARSAGVSAAAPYRHFPNHEALLVELSLEGFAELQEEIVASATGPGLVSDRVCDIGAAYMRFVARRPALARLMFGAQLPNRESFPQLGNAADGIGNAIGTALGDTALGLAVWAAVHGLAMLVLEDVVDLGQRRSGLDVLPSRAEILLRSLFSLPQK